jgi:preprotein translocase subunit SecG
VVVFKVKGGFMKRISVIIIFGFLAIGLLVSCGEKTTVKQDVKQDVKPDKPAYDKMNDTAFANVMAVLKESLDAEKANSDSTTKLNAAKAYILLIKFVHTDKEKVQKSGMTDEDITFLVSDAKEKAQSRLKDIIGNDTAPKAVKEEAQSKLKELETL